MSLSVCHLRVPTSLHRFPPNVSHTHICIEVFGYGGCFFCQHPLRQSLRLWTKPTHRCCRPSRFGDNRSSTTFHECVDDKTSDVREIQSGLPAIRCAATDMSFYRRCTFSRSPGTRRGQRAYFATVYVWLVGRRLDGVRSRLRYNV